MLYRVEREESGAWQPVEEAVDAESHHQAVVRACEEEGSYRAQAHGDLDYLHFRVPSWGPPEEIG